jgi:hypothetical protein
LPITTYSKETYTALAIDERFLRQLTELLLKHDITPKFTVKLSNDSSIDEMTLAELLDLPNTKHRAIQRLELRSPYNSKIKVRLQLKGEFSEQTCSYEVVGDDKDATYIASGIDRLIKDAKRSLSYFSSMPPTHAGAWWMGLSSVPILLLVIYYSFGVPKIVSFGILYLFVCIVTVALSLAYGRIAGWFAPPIFFMIGDGIDRAGAIRRRAASIVSILFIVVVLGVIVSVSSNWLFEKYFKAGS